jgi:nucleoside-diphosphate-sugar epimerase
VPTRLVVGAGAVGTPLVDRLVARGDSVRVATRGGTTLGGATALALDAKDVDALTRAADGADTIVVCANPPYTAWGVEWPAITTALVEAAATTGASVVVMGNLYGHGPVSEPMTEHTPLAAAEGKGRVRADCWRRLLLAADRGVRAVEVRASDYFGPGAGRGTHLGSDFFGPLVAGRTAHVVGDVTQPHAWAYLPDVVSTLVAAIDRDEWGRAWLAPHATHASRVEIADEARRRHGLTGRVRPWNPLLWAGLTRMVPFLREVGAMQYQFDSPFVVDPSESERLLGIGPTPWPEALDETIAATRSGTRRP